MVLRLKNILRWLCRDPSGGALPLIGISMMALVGVVGFSLDTGRAYAVKSRLSTAIDAASLAGAKVLTASNSGSATLETEIQNMFNANMSANYLGATVSTPKLSDGSICVGTYNASGSCVADSTNRVLSIKATASVPTFIMQVFTVGTPTVTLTASANKQINNIEIVLVLDNSGSMANTLSGSSTSKLANLKLAANNLITQLSGAVNGTSGTVKFGVVPSPGS